MDGEEQVLTYAELAQLWGVGIKAAKARVRRAGWARETHNDPRAPAKVRVPARALAVPATEPETNLITFPGPRSPSVPHGGPSPDDLAIRLEHLQEANAKLRAELAAAQERARSAAAVALADVATAQAETEGRDAVIAELRTRVTELQAELHQLRMPWWQRIWRGVGP